MNNEAIIGSCAELRIILKSHLSATRAYNFCIPPCIPYDGAILEVPIKIGNLTSLPKFYQRMLL